MPDTVKTWRRDAAYAEKSLRFISLRPLRLRGETLKAEPTAAIVQEADRQRDIGFCPIPIFRSDKGIRFDALHGPAVTPFADASLRRPSSGLSGQEGPGKPHGRC